MNGSTLYLEGALAPLAPFLARPDVTDLYINRPGELWTETLSGDIGRHPTPDLTPALLLMLARQVAAIGAQGINREHPLLAASLPGGERVQIVIPPATRGDVAIAIRKHVSAALSLDELVAGGLLHGTKRRDGRTGSPDEAIAPADEETLTLLRRAVRERRNILISGGTSTGKTTLLAALLREIPERERLLLIEDTPELPMTHPNSIGLIAVRGTLGEAAVTAEDLLIAALRMRPDRIILGEIRGGEAATFLRAINTGHPGSLSTIHANSPSRAIDQLALLVLQTGMRMDWDNVVTYVRRSLDLIVQLRRGPGGRVVETIETID